MIETISGRVTTQGRGSLTINLFFRDSTGREQALFLAEKDEKAGVRTVGQVDVIPAVSNGNHGNMLWSKKRYEMPEGSYVKVVLHRTQTGNGAFRNSMSAIMLRYRSGGPLNRLTIEFPTDSRSSMSVGYIEGRFDVLREPEIKELKLHINRAGSNELALYDRGGYEDYVILAEIEPAIVAHQKPKMQAVKQQASGKTVGVLRVKPKRRIATS